jgi:pyruvate ferredoxin oxidoreductase alpha subunit
MIRNTKVKAMTGGYAMAEALRQVHPDVMAVYPITPQTPIIETYARMKAGGEVTTEIVQAESEHSAMSATVGASASGARAVTATSSQGLLYMTEILPIASGLRLPIVMCVSSRSLSAPLNIHGEHGDVMVARNLGWVQIFSQNVQEAYDNVIISTKLAETMDIPVMPIMDGFHVSHTTERIEVCTDREVRRFIGTRSAKKTLLNLSDPVTFGPVALQNSYFEFKIDQEKEFENVKKEYKKICAEYGKISGRKYGMFESYRLNDAKYAIVMMGATVGTAKEAIDLLRAKGEKVGLLNMRLYRPFPYEEVGEELAHIRKIAVLDRVMSFGAYPPLYQDVVSSMQHAASRKYEIASYIYGLGGRDTTQSHIKKVFKDLEEGEISKKIKYSK